MNYQLVDYIPFRLFEALESSTNLRRRQYHRSFAIKLSAPQQRSPSALQLSTSLNCHIGVLALSPSLSRHTCQLDVQGTCEIAAVAHQEIHTFLVGFVGLVGLRQARKPDKSDKMTSFIMMVLCTGLQNTTTA